MTFATWNVRGNNNKMNEIVSEVQNGRTLTKTKKKGYGLEIKGKYIHLYGEGTEN